jgi:hypothetical protein
VPVVVEMPQFLSDAKGAGLSEDERAKVINRVASNPTAGDLIPGTGGARKVRFAGRGKGKSGGYVLCRSARPGVSARPLLER